MEHTTNFSFKELEDYLSTMISDGNLKIKVEGVDVKKGFLIVRWNNDS